MTDHWLQSISSSIAHEIADAEYARLLGLPRREPLAERWAERAFLARQWYARYGRPFSSARQLEIAGLDADGVTLQDGTVLRSAALGSRLRDGHSPRLAIVAVSAGPEVDAETDRLWKDDRLDEAFFLDRLGAAVAEHLVRWTSIAICREAEAARLTALPPLSPGCADWDLADQRTLLALFGDATGPLVMLPSGMMTPKNSMLAAVGLTEERYAMTADEACRSCDLSPCAFRRAPFGLVRLQGGPSDIGAEVSR